MKHSNFEWNMKGFVEILNGSETGAVLDGYADTAEAAALSIYLSRSKGEEKAPVYYATSFFQRKRSRLGVQTREVGNNDPEWVYVEFGLNAGNSGRVYKYRPLGLALDVLESGG